MCRQPSFYSPSFVCTSKEKPVWDTFWKTFPATLYFDCWSQPHKYLIKVTFSRHCVESYPWRDEWPLTLTLKEGMGLKPQLKSQWEPRSMADTQRIGQRLRIPAGGTSEPGLKVLLFQERHQSHAPPQAARALPAHIAPRSDEEMPPDAFLLVCFHEYWYSSRKLK